MGVVCLAVLTLVCGCERQVQGTAEEAAIARHEQEVQLRKSFVKEITGPNREQLIEGLKFLEMLANSDQLPGLTAKADVELGGMKSAVSPRGAFYMTEEFHVRTKIAPVWDYGYVVARAYSNSDFQLMRAWRTGTNGKVAETYMTRPGPGRASADSVFVGPGNAGAERGWDGWYNGVEGGGLVSVEHDNPATGFSYFKIGITNADEKATNHADIRSEAFSLGGARGPLTFSFAYKLPEKVKPGDNVQVALRFFGEGEGSFLGQQTLEVGAHTGDSEMAAYKTIKATGIFAPSGAVSADVWMVANIFEPWTSGYAQFDDFSVTMGPKRSWGGILAGVGSTGGVGCAGVVLVQEEEGQGLIWPALPGRVF